jgi:hypothetical protein
MSLEETVITLKKRFIASQVRLLNGTLRPTRDWQENAPRTEHGDLSERTVGEALYRGLFSIAVRERAVEKAC